MPADKEITVRVIGPFAGQGHSRTFPAGISDEEILMVLSGAETKMLMGRVGVKKKIDDVFKQEVWHADDESPWLIDDPRTVVSVGHSPDGRKWIETRRLKGPPAPPETPKEGG